MVDLSPRCPWRPPDWRWRLAGLRVEHGVRAARRWDDDWVRRAARLLRAARRTGGDVLHPRAARVDPALAGAVALRRAGAAAARPLELRLLAGLPTDLAAAACGLGPEVAAAYEAAFLDLAARLGAEHWVLFRVVDPAGRLLSGATSREAVGRLLAYRGGPVAAEAAIEWLEGARSGRNVLDGRTENLLEALLLSLSLPAEARRLGHLLDWCARLARLRRADRQVGGPPGLPAGVVAELGDRIAAIDGADRPPAAEGTDGTGERPGAAETAGFGRRSA